MPEISQAGPGPRYRALCRAAELTGDADQNLAADKLQALYERLAAREAHSPPRWWRKKSPASGAELRGLYLHGAVGRGKSMLMDLFFHEASLAAKRRVHFHAFMQEVHGELFRHRQGPAGRGDPIPALAQRLAKAAHLLCFDEFQVTDVADAMILGRLFEALLDRGVIIVATSNAAPDDLYAGGINRQLFLPFIEMLKSRMDVLHLGGDTDYRLLRLAGQPVWHSPLGEAASAALDAAFAALTDGETAPPETLAIQGRGLLVERHGRNVARFGFAELCARPLGPADYLAIARRFHALVLSDIPLLTPELRNEARRFTTLIDALYEAKAKLIASAAASPQALFQGPDSAAARCISRLMEMQSADYRARSHVSGL